MPGEAAVAKLPKKKCCESQVDSCNRCPLRMLKEGTLPAGLHGQEAQARPRSDGKKVTKKKLAQGCLTGPPSLTPRSSPVPAPRFVDQLNVQIGNELAAHNQYLACAVHYDALTMPRMAAFFYGQALEERGHAMMMVQYLLDTDADVVIPGVEAPSADVRRRGRAVAARARRRRSGSPSRSTACSRIAREEYDFASEQFMQWFIKEQVEEVATMSDLLAVVTRNRDDIEDIEEYVAREQSGRGGRPHRAARGRRLTLSPAAARSPSSRGRTPRAATRCGAPRGA